MDPQPHEPDPTPGPEHGAHPADVVPDVMPDLVWEHELCEWDTTLGPSGGWRITQPADGTDPEDLDTWTGQVLETAPQRLTIRWDHGTLETRAEHDTGVDVVTSAWSH